MPADDLEKFTRWLERNYGGKVLNPLTRVLDLGCGNGRNLIYLAKEFGCRGGGFDLSAEAIKLAKTAAPPFKNSRRLILLGSWFLSKLLPIVIRYNNKEFSFCQSPLRSFKIIPKNSQLPEIYQITFLKFFPVFGRF